MIKTLLVLATFFSVSMANAETVITSCRLDSSADVSAVGTIAVSRDEDGVRVMEARLAFSGVLFGDGLCSSRRCVFKHDGEPSVADTVYTLIPVFQKGSDRIVGMTMNMRSSIIDANDHLGKCRPEKELPEDIY